MSTLNKIQLIGHTGNEVELVHFDNGGTVGKVSLATNEVYVNKNTGEKVKNTEWHNIVLRNKAAEICSKYLRKGDKVYFEGKLKTRKWEGNDGVTRYITEVQAEKFLFLSPKNSSGSANQGSAVDEYNQRNQDSNQDFNDDDHDDLPF